MAHLTGFAEACYNDNTIEELIDGLESRVADPTDCKNWGITPTAWRNALGAALREKIANYTDVNGFGFGKDRF